MYSSNTLRIGSLFSPSPPKKKSEEERKKQPPFAPLVQNILQNSLSKNHFYRLAPHLRCSFLYTFFGDLRVVAYRSRFGYKNTPLFSTEAKKDCAINLLLKKQLVFCTIH